MQLLKQRNLELSLMNGKFSVVMLCIVHKHTGIAMYLYVIYLCAYACYCVTVLTICQVASYTIVHKEGGPVLEGSVTPLPLIYCDSLCFLLVILDLQVVRLPCTPPVHYHLLLPPYHPTTSDCSSCYPLYSKVDSTELTAHHVVLIL